MRPAPRVPLRTLAVLVLLVAPRAAAEVDLDAPVDGPSVAGPIPALPGVAPLLEPPAFLTGPLFAHEARLTLVADPGGIPPTSPACPALPGDPSGTAAAPALPAHVQEALAESDASVAQLDGGSILDFFEAFEDAVELLGGDAETSLGATAPACFGPAPAQARWLRSQYVPRNFYFLPGQGEFFYSYAGRPFVFQEIRQRGARLYCAAREAQFQQAGVSSMGERAGFSVKILGKQIDFLVSEATLVLDGPERFTGMGANDGAQAFELPLLFGTRITPIRGLGLPSFRETRVPMSLVVADSEVRSAAELRPVRTGSSVQCQFQDSFPYVVCSLVPTFVTQHAKRYQSVSHLTRLRSARKDATVTGSTEVFRVGPVAVKLGFELGYQLGGFQPEPERVIDLPGFPLAREGRLWIHPFTGSTRHDGPWSLRWFGGLFAGGGFPFWTVLPDGLTNAFWRQPLNLLIPPPLHVRLFHDDDHAVDGATGLEMAGSLSGLFGGSFGPFEVSLEVQGKIVGTVVQHHRLREALLAEDLGGPAMTAATALRVRPQQTGEAHLEPAKGTLNLFLGLPFPFEDIDITKTLFSVPKVELASYDSDESLTAAHELVAFQLGTGSAQGDVTEQPVARSHFPGGLEFPSFPQDVDACLADPTPNPETPPPCDPVDDPGEPPGAEVCLYGPGPGLRTLLGSLPPGVCGQIPGFVAGLGLGPAQGQCLVDFLGFLCAPVSKQQTFAGLSVVSHVLDLEDPAEGDALAPILAACGLAFGTPGPDGSIPTSEVADAFVSARLCTPDGTLLSDQDVLGAVGNPDVAPPLQPGPACH